MPADQKTRLGTVQHETFCLPRPGAEAPRLEGFVVYEDEPSGRARPAAFCTRCIECGASSYQRTEQ